MNFEIFQSRVYGPQPCWELVADVYAAEGHAVPVDYQTITRSVREMAAAFRIALHKSPHGFVQTLAPVDGCIVLLGKNDRIGIHHCGVYQGGSVLHAMPGITQLEELASLRDRYAVVEFWAKPGAPAPVPAPVPQPPAAPAPSPTPSPAPLVAAALRAAVKVSL